MKRDRILEAGRNCWCVHRAKKVAFLVDGAAYFKALYDSFPLAERQILILAWDIYSRLHLVPPQDDGDGHKSSALGKLLDQLVREKRRLGVNILDWDYSLLYSPSREWLPVLQFDWKTHRRLRFCLDDQYPLGASHHQKVVVIDDALAFAGGLDLTRGRWDTPEHRPDDPRRQAVDGSELPVRPHHDVQMAVAGPVAAALGDLARERWRRGTQKELAVPPKNSGGIWPAGLRVDIEDAEVAIVRTVPAFREYPEVREVEQLYLDAIGAAREYIYIENQFFTAPSISKALADRLTEPDGPEVILIFPLKTSGWLSQQSMDVMRVVAIRTLREADKHGRLAIYYPHKPDLGEHSINVHAKLMVMDDVFVRVGSANLNNRSMGLDTECDLALEAPADNPSVSNSIRGLRNRLLAEHLGCDPEEVDSAVEQHGSLLQGIEALRGGERTLCLLEPCLPEPDESILHDIQLTDPERPVDSETFLKQFVSDKQAKPAGHRILRWVAVIILLLSLAAAWQFTPMREWLDIATLTAIADQLRGSGIAPVVVIAAFVVGSFLVVPITAMIILSVLIFDPAKAFAYALTGSMLSAVAGYGLGAWLGRNAVIQLAGERINQVSKTLAKRGLATMLVVRIVPVAPFTVVNLVAGASHIRFRDFALGSLIGMAPGILAITLVTDRIVAAIRSPDWQTILILIIVAAVVIAAGYLLSTRLLNLAKKAGDGQEEQNGNREP